MPARDLRCASRNCKTIGRKSRWGRLQIKTVDGPGNEDQFMFRAGPPQGIGKTFGLFTLTVVSAVPCRMRNGGALLRT